MKEKASRMIADVVPMTTRKIRADMRRLARPDLTILQLRVLIRTEAAVHTNKQLAEWAGISKATMSRALATMERKGLIRKKKATADKREVFIYLTSFGKSKYRSIQGKVTKIIAEKLQKLKKEELKSLVKGLIVLKGVFEK